MRTVIVGYDGSPASDRALERSIQLAGGDGRVVLVTASVPPAAPAFVDEPMLDSPDPGERRALLERAARALGERGIEHKLVPADDAPAEALIAAARAEQADLIVVGRTGSGYVTRAIIGSTAEQVVRQAPCDVLVVR
jgi:nucleotide-binding universal stress UspA family protein